jgi:RNA polymerase sigma-70 factor, ECF subfamily
VEASEQRTDQGVALLALYDRALPQVYGYFVRRVPTAAIAEDLTAEVFLAAVRAVHDAKVEQMTVAWLIGVARHKLVDHWRRAAREERALELASDSPATADDWTDVVDPGRAMTALSTLGAHHRAALSLRYLDGLAVAEVARLLDRTVHATEALLVRARVAFRRAYEMGGDDG